MAGLSTKLSVPVVVIASLAIGLTAFLNLGKFERSLSELEESRARLIVQDIHGVLELGLGLGLPLHGVANAQVALEYAVQQDPGIQSITVYDQTGALAFHAGYPLDENKLPASWRPYLSGRAAKSWVLREDHAEVIGAGLISAIGTPVGGVALRYSLREHEEAAAQMAAYLRRIGLLGMLLTALAGAISIHLLVMRSNRKLARMERILAGKETPALDAALSETSRMAQQVAATSQAALLALRQPQEKS